MTAVPVFQEVGIPMITPQAGQVDVTLTGNYIFRMCTIASFEGNLIARRMIEDGCQNLAVIYSNDDYGVNILETWSGVVEEMGGTVIAAETFVSGQTKDFTPLLSKLKTNGLLGYLKGFCDPIFVMAPFNVLGEVFTPISMAFRHFGNIVSGTVISTLVYAALVVANHALFSIIPGVVGQWLGAIPFLTVGIPAIISLYFDWFGSFMQAFIFCMLTMMFISTAAE